MAHISYIRFVVLKLLHNIYIKNHLIVFNYYIFYILCKNQMSFHKRDSFLSDVTTCYTTSIYGMTVWLSKIMLHVSPLVEILSHSIIFSYILSWNQYRMNIISPIIFFLYKHNRNPSVASNSTIWVSLIIIFPIIGHMSIIMNQQFISDCKSCCIFITSQICWLLDMIKSIE